MKFHANEPKKGTLKIQKSQIAILVLNQSPISAVFPIVRFAEDPKTALTGDFLYICLKFTITIFLFRSGGWEWHRCTFESRCNQASANFDQFEYFTSRPDRSDKFLPDLGLKDVNQSFEFKKKFNGFINGRISGRFTNGLWYFDFFNQFGSVLCFERTQYSWRLKYEFGSVF